MADATPQGEGLAEYIAAAVERATYEVLSAGTYYGGIPGFQGVYANADNLEDCKAELGEVLEDWIALGRKLGHQTPVLQTVEPTPDRETD